MNITVNIVATDTGPNLQFTIKDDDGTAIDVTGTTVNLAFAPHDGTYTAIFVESCELTTPTSGIVTYKWADHARTIAAQGAYIGQIQIVGISGMNISSTIFPINISRKLM